MIKIRHLIEYVPIYLLYRLCRLIGFSKASALGGFIGRTMGYVYALIQGVADNNIERVFPNLTKQQRRQLIRKSCDNFGRTFFEFFVLDIAEKDKNYKCIEINFPQIKQVCDDGTSLLFISAHLGNWEIAAKFAATRGYPFSVIYRHINNPYVNALILKCRQSIVDKQIPKGRRSGLDSLKVLKSKGRLALLIDQKYNEGVEIPFFGVPAKTADGFVKLAQKTSSKIIPVLITRYNKTEFIVRFSTDILDTTNLSTEEILIECNRHLENWITSYPDQWFWFHRRWDKKLYQFPQSHKND